MRRLVFALLLAGGLGASVAHAAHPKNATRESARLTGHAVRDGAQTVGRTIGAFFKGGPHAAKRTWKANAARTRHDARTDKARVRAAAH